MQLIDIHTHIYPPAIARKAADSIREFYQLEGVNEMDGTADTLLKRGDAAGIDRFVILPVAVRADRTRHINDFILEEYRDVLLRPKFHLAKDDVDSFIMRIKHYGYNVEPTPTEEEYPDPDDAVFYETALTIKKDVCLIVTGNIKHYPNKEFVITPAEMAVRLDES